VRNLRLVRYPKIGKTRYGTRNPFSMFLSVVIVVFVLCWQSIVMAIPVADKISVGAGGEWFEMEETHLTLNPETNRLYSIVRGGSQVETLIAFDASTNALSSSIPLPNFGDRIIGLAVDPVSNDVYVNYGDYRSGSRENPRVLDVIDLDTFPVSPIAPIDVQIHHFDLDVEGRRLIGITEPTVGTDFYRVVVIDLDTHSVVEDHETTLPKKSIILRDALLDTDRDTFLVLFSPIESPTFSNTPKFEGVVVGIAPLNGNETVRSATLDGDFTTHSLALSPDRHLLSVVHDSGIRKPIKLLDPATLLSVGEIDLDDLSPTFNPRGSAIFSSTQHLWITNSYGSKPEESIAVYDVKTSQLAEFVGGALGSEALAVDLDEERNKVFAASSRNDSFYVIKPNSTFASTVIDIGVHPKDLAYDVVNDRVIISSDFGDLHFLSNHPTGNESSQVHYIGRSRGFGNQPVTGLIMDENRNRVFVGNQRNHVATIHETFNYEKIDQFPIPADVWTFDASRNQL